MNGEYSDWFQYADENLDIARIALERGYYNACLQNVQQAVEKFLKGALLYQGKTFPKTHNIENLLRQLEESKIRLDISQEDAELLDAIYVPSKYPLGSALPDFTPDKKLGTKCLDIGEQARRSAKRYFSAQKSARKCGK